MLNAYANFDLVLKSLWFFESSDLDIINIEFIMLKLFYTKSSGWHLKIIRPLLKSELRHVFTLLAFSSLEWNEVVIVSFICVIIHIIYYNKYKYIYLLFV